jgi:hypothetical protein
MDGTEAPQWESQSSAVAAPKGEIRVSDGEGIIEAQLKVKNFEKIPLNIRPLNIRQV